MHSESSQQKLRTYLAVDVGGTKIQASVVQGSGEVLVRQRHPTPREGGPEETLLAIEAAIDAALAAAAMKPGDLTACGIAIPGVVDPDTGRIVVTPNMNLTGVDIRAHLQRRFDLPVAVGNDCNLGTLGETWLGSARNARSAVGILVGTGIGCGIVSEGRLWRGAREAAAEIGHIVMEMGGPKCGCGNLGCFEALASRTAIERQLREAVAAGRKTVLTEILEGDLSVIRSSALRKALEAGDELVTEVMRRASEVLGHACMTVRHLIDPEVIVLGGGVVEATSDFILPIVEKIVGSDQLPGAREGGQVLLSALGDDAVVLGAVALAREHVGRSPFEKRFAVKPAYPQIDKATFGEVTVDDRIYDNDIVIDVDGKVKDRKKNKAKKLYGSAHTVGPEELKKLCRGGPEVLFVGSGHSGQMDLNEAAREFLSQRSIELEIAPTSEVVDAYNDCPKRKAALIHVTC